MGSSIVERVLTRVPASEGGLWLDSDVQDLIEFAPGLLGGAAAPPYLVGEAAGRAGGQGAGAGAGFFGVLILAAAFLRLM